jgi:hypothetical protein
MGTGLETRCLRSASSACSSISLRWPFQFPRTPDNYAWPLIAHSQRRKYTHTASTALLIPKSGFIRQAVVVPLRRDNCLRGKLIGNQKRMLHRVLSLITLREKKASQTLTVVPSCFRQEKLAKENNLEMIPVAFSAHNCKCLNSGMRIICKPQKKKCLDDRSCIASFCGTAATLLHTQQMMHLNAVSSRLLAPLQRGRSETRGVTVGKRRREESSELRRSETRRIETSSFC